MPNIVSYSVWGKDESYYSGAIHNARIVPKIYPGYIARFYCSQEVPQNVLDELKSLKAEVINMQLSDDPALSWEGLFWRFYALEEKGIVLIRDIDSRVNSREKAAIDDWLKESWKSIHNMRDHPDHTVPMLGGMFAAKDGALSSIKTFIDIWKNFDRREYYFNKYLDVTHARDPLEKFGQKGCDQDFLREIIWPIFSRVVVTYDQNCVKYNDLAYQKLPYDFGPHEVRPFPKHKPMDYGTYCGERI